MDTEIAKILNVSDGCIYYWRKKLGLATKFNYSKVSKIDNEKFEQLFYAGKNDREIAIELGMSQDGIYSHRMRYGYLRENYTESKPRCLTHIQKQLLLGTLMGDLSMSVCGKHARGRCCHCVDQKEYCEYKANCLSSLGAKMVYSKRKSPDCRNGKYYEEYHFSLPSNPELDKWYNAAYDKDGRRKIPFEFFEYFSPLSLACYFMDDGSKTKCGYMFSSVRYSKDDLMKFISFIKEKFGLEMTIQKNNILYIKANSRKKFEDLVSPYIVDSMKYKLHNVS